SKVNLAHVKMVGADFRNAILKDTIFTQANLNYADFRGAKNLTREQINKAKSHEGIYLPDDIARSTPTDSNSKP
ncbi:MAG: pentapeptide repeat-containing protein, partial [Nostoc sp.]